MDIEHPDKKAVRLLTRQLEVLRNSVRGLDDKDPNFKAWRDATRGILERFLGPDSVHATRFRDTRFYGPSYVQSDYPGTRRIPDSIISREQFEAFQKGCEMAEASLKAAIDDFAEFGVHQSEETRPCKRGQVGAAAGA
jgi:hypothetical protein